MQSAVEINTFYSQSLTHNPLLLRLWTNYYKNFVYSLSQRLWPSHDIGEIDKANIYNALMQCEGLALHEQYFTKALGIHSLRNEDFSNNATRIALLPQAYLYHLALLAGMTLCREDIVKVVSRQDVEKIKNLERIIPIQHNTPDIELNLYDFAVQKSIMYKGHSDHVRQKALADPCTHIFDSLPLDERIVAWGLWSVLSCVQLGGQNLVLRSLVMLDGLCAYVPKIQIFSQHLSTLPSYNLSDFTPQYNSCSKLNSDEAVAWPILRVLLFKSIPCPWEEGWTTFFA